MTQPFADALSWVPKSRALGATLGRAHDLARAQGHASVTLEHLLLALIEDPDASSVLLSCNIDLLSLNEAVSAHVQLQQAGASGMPEAAPALLTILEYAVAAARQSKRSEISGAIVLAAIVGEGKSEAARLLKMAGLKFEDAVQALRRSNARPAVAEPQVPPAAHTPPAAPPPPAVPPPALPASAPSPAAQPPALPAAAQPPIQPSPSDSGISAPSAEPGTAHNGAHAFDDDPVTTARRRIAAIRSGQPPPMPAPNPVAAHGANAGHGKTANGVGSDWTPPPLPQPAAASVRPPRLPPPVPPMADAPLRTNGVATNRVVQARAPWSDATAEHQAESAPQKSVKHGAPIDPAALIKCIPERMRSRTPMTVEIRIPRPAVLATATANSVPGTPERDVVVTRALAVKLRAPAGGFHIENAAPETQWFDTRSQHREDDEVRWRWLVTPHGPGEQTLQLSISIRAIAGDGMIVETTLPEHQGMVQVLPNHVARMWTGLGLVTAALVGAAIALLISGGLAMLTGQLSG